MKSSKKKSNPKNKLSIVIPAYNEEDNFNQGSLDSIYKYLIQQKYSWEVLLVDDGSTDNTSKLLSDFAKKNKGFVLKKIKHGGKVWAVSEGVKEAKGEIILFSDFDQSTPISEVEKVLKKIDEGFDVVIGDRGLKAARPFLHKIRSKIFNLLVQAVILPGIQDSQCGFKAFKVDAAKKIFPLLKVTKKKYKGSYMGAFDVEVLYLAKKFNFKITSVPIKWRAFKSNKLSFTEPFKMLVDIFRIRLLS